LDSVYPVVRVDCRVWVVRCARFLHFQVEECREQFYRTTSFHSARLQLHGLFLRIKFARLIVGIDPHLNRSLNRQSNLERVDLERRKIFDCLRPRRHPGWIAIHGSGNQILDLGIYLKICRHFRNLNHLLDRGILRTTNHRL
jgi:hypothetical protein